MNASHWNTLISSLPDAHLLQTWEWAQIKGDVGWKANPYAWSPDGKLLEPLDLSGGQVSAAAMILQRCLPSGGIGAWLRILYTPKGPLMDWNNTTLRQQVLDDLSTIARKSGAIFIKIDPNVLLGEGISGEPGSQTNPLGQEVLKDLKARGWRYSSDQIQFRNTVWVDLSGSEEEILARMKQKTRYNIRLAERKGVTVRRGGVADINLLYRMYAETSVRDGFVIRGEDYYGRVWKTFLENSGKQADSPLPCAQPLIAEVEGDAVAAIIPVRFAGTAWYLYGMSCELHREKMPNYLLQWEAIRWAKQAGCQVYDLWGAPDEFTDEDSMWGVYKFKEGLGGCVIRTIGAWDLPVRPLFYRLYTQTLPRLLDVMRRHGKQHTRKILAG